MGVKLERGVQSEVAAVQPGAVDLADSDNDVQAGVRP